ncbi:ABC transporter permease [Methanocella sp. MCL-LM]|uniref:ABC transporter permease n=1 Tax=Methanocella sp. MCL-LM TaxID=3412035 RepID=UPI003C708093
MGNFVNIARKEFADLVSSPMVLVVLAGYFVVLMLNFFMWCEGVPNMDLSIGFSHSYGMVFADNLFAVLSSSYGPIVGVMIGCASIASERHNNALSILLTKPVYRDTIINGKLLGSLLFLMLILGFSIILYTSCLFVFCGGAISSSTGDYVSRLPIIFAFSIILVAIYWMVAVLLSLLVKNTAFALITGSLLVFIAEFVSMSSFADMVSNLFPGQEFAISSFIVSLTPGGFLWPIREILFNSAYDLSQSLLLILPDMAKFSLYALTICVVSYIVFVRRDEA